MKTSPTIGLIAPALLKAQTQMGSAVKSSNNPFFKSKYADLNAIREASLPILNACGISVIQPTQVDEDGSQSVMTVLLHESGEFISALTKVVVGKQNDPQAAGSGLSYARRYGLQSLLNIGAEDDDGEKSMERSPVKGTTFTTRAAESPTATVTVTAVLAKAQAAVARKVVTKQDILVKLKKEFAIDTDSVTVGISNLSRPHLTTFNSFIEGVLK